MSVPFRIGIGYDVHRLEEGRKLILGGVEIPYNRGLKGHSDGDCLSHALADAILGAAGLPDIGYYFPPDNPDYEGINSQLILKKAVSEASRKNLALANVDVAVIAEEPKIAPYRDAMKEVLSETLQIKKKRISIKATTHEGLGDLGKGLGIATHAVALLQKI